LQAPDTPQDVLSRRFSNLDERARLLAFGDAAVEPIVNALNTEQNVTTIRAVVLIGVLESLNSDKSKGALRTLLSDARPMIRAYTANALGRVRDQCSVPDLIRLIGVTRRSTREI